MDLTKMLMDQLGQGGLEQLGQQIGMSSDQTGSALGAAVPMLLGAMAKNTQAGNSGGAEGLLGALDRDHDGSILDDVAGFLSNTQSGNGEGILKHILGDQRSAVENGVAQKMGVDAGSIGKLLTAVAPLIMGFLGREKRQSGGLDMNAGGLTDILANLAGGSRQQGGIDIGDIMDMMGGLSGNNSGSGGLGGMLGKILGR